MVESKSFKLYLNSLNNTRFDSDEQAVATIIARYQRARAGAPVELELFDVGRSRAGRCSAGRAAAWTICR